MATKMAAACQFAIVDTLNRPSISSKFHILLPMFEYGICLIINDNQDSLKNGYYPLFTAGHLAGPFVRKPLFESWGSHAVCTWLITSQDLKWALICLHGDTWECAATRNHYFNNGFVHECKRRKKSHFFVTFFTSSLNFK